MKEPSKAGAGHQRLQVLLLFFYGFGNAASYLLARTVADSEFLSRFGSKRLPALYLVSAGVVALTSLAYSSAQQKTGLKQSIVLTLASFAALTCVFALLIPLAPKTMIVFVAMYLLTQVRGSLGTIQFSTVLNEQFLRSGTVQVVGIVGAGATLAGILIGAMVSNVPDSVQIEWLLYLAAAIDILTILPLISLRALRKQQKKANRRAKKKSKAKHNDKTEKPKHKHRKKSIANPRVLLSSPYVFGITSIVTCAIMATTILEFQWKSIASIELERNKHELARYFGMFYGVVYALTGMTQLLITSRLLQRNSMFFGLLILPVALFVGLISLIVNSAGPLLGTLSMCKGTDTLRRSIHDPTIQVLYSPLKKRFRRQVITFVSGIAKPFTEAVAAILIVIAAMWIPVEKMHYIAIPWVVIWTGIALHVWVSYRSQSRGNAEKM